MRNEKGHLSCPQKGRAGAKARRYETSWLHTSFHRCLLRTSWVLAAVLGAGDPAGNTADQALALTELTVHKRKMWKRVGDEEGQALKPYRPMDP